MNPPDGKLVDQLVFRWITAGIMGLFAISMVHILRMPPPPGPHSDPVRPKSDLLHPLPSFQLMERSGRVVTEADLAGKYVVANFVFTSCGTSCLRVSERMSEIQKLCEEKEVVLVSVTIDPRSDTAKVLSTFADKFGASQDRWLFLTGETDKVRSLIQDGFLEKGESLTELLIPRPDDGTQGIPLLNRIMVMDRHGGVRSYVDGTEASATSEVMGLIATLQTERAGL